MIGWTRIVSSSRNVSRWASMAVSATTAALSALIPRCGAPPAWAPLPTKRMNFTTQPLWVSPTLASPSSGRAAVWVMVAMSTSSNSPRRISSALPARNSTFPCSRSPIRHSTSTYSSAGTANRTTSPSSSSMHR